MSNDDIHSNDRAWLDEQIAYYRALAPGYDQASSPPPPDARTQQSAMLRDALDRFAPNGHAVEIACGTGQWTTELIRQPVTAITALDSAPEMINIAKTRIGSDSRVGFIVADVFTWSPPQKYDVVVFANFLSHVPPGSFETFWRTVAHALVPDGRVFFIDERSDVLGRSRWSGPGLPLEDRELPDGRIFRAVKVYWDPLELETRLRSLGWDITVTPTGDAFYWGEGSRKE